MLFNKKKTDKLEFTYVAFNFKMNEAHNTKGRIGDDGNPLCE